MNTKHWLYVLIAGIVMTACTKTEVVEYEKELANRILEYKVTNAAEALHGVVDDIDNTITVYVPYYLSISYIVPKIVLEDGATLIDADGDVIDTREYLEPVPFDSVGYTYRVKDNNNIVRLYTLVTRMLPHVDPLKLGYAIKFDQDGNILVDDAAPKEAIINSRINIYGNLESSSHNAKLSLIDKKTNTVVPNGLKLYDVGRTDFAHYITTEISADIDSGYYYIVVSHQGRTDTLPTIHMQHKKPFFDYLAKSYSIGDIVTLNVRGKDAGEVYSGSNTGITRMYIRLIKTHFTKLPANFPEALFDKPIALEIISQSRTQVQFRFPELPPGAYETSVSSGGGENGYVLNYSGFGIYFDFNDTTWGKDNLLSTIAYNLEIKAKKN
jgi:hypothetical protein